jgi:hypothetical protein
VTWRPTELTSTHHFRSPSVRDREPYARSHPLGEVCCRDSRISLILGSWDFVAVFSDGVTQVDGMDWRDVVAELMNFKSIEGDFVKRRMNRFLKDCRAHGKGPIDDISMACIHIDHEEQKERPEPCTQEARTEGCTCRMESVSSASIDPPEPIVDGWCPVHGGRDPDAERDRQRDDGEV